MDQFTDFLAKYWGFIVAAVAAFMAVKNPKPTQALLSKVGLAKAPEEEAEEESDDLDLVNDLARANLAKGYGAEAEIQAIYQKFSAGGK